MLLKPPLGYCNDVKSSATLLPKHANALSQIYFIWRYMLCRFRSRSMENCCWSGCWPKQIVGQTNQISGDLRRHDDETSMWMMMEYNGSSVITFRVFPCNHADATRADSRFVPSQWETTSFIGWAHTLNQSCTTIQTCMKLVTLINLYM